MKKYIISVVSIIFLIVNISLAIIFYFINIDSIESCYLILQFQLLLYIFFIVLKFQLGVIKTMHIKYFAILPVTKIHLLYNTFSLFFHDLRFILIVSSFLLADYIIFVNILDNSLFFILSFIINVFYYIILTFIIYNINNNKKGHEYLSILLSISIIFYNVPLITKVYSLPLYSPLSAIIFLPVFGNLNYYVIIILVFIIELCLFKYLSSKNSLIK